MEMSVYINETWYCGSYLSDAKRNELIQEGWQPSQYSRDHFVKGIKYLHIPLK